MSETFDCDPNKGFVAFPVAIFDLDLTPGAFRTLAELCRMANTSGQCWPSLAQLGTRLGRSRAAVSGYITELRRAGVLSTEEQKMANGYNYRLRYTVTFWKAWRAKLGTQKAPVTAVQKAERRVHPVERPLETKNHIHQNKQSGLKFPDLVSEWKAVVGKSHYPLFSTWPSEGLLRKSADAVALAPPPAPFISADIAASFEVFAQKHGLAAQPLDPSAGALITTQAQLDAVITTLESTWEAHWKKLPNAFQVARILKTQAPATDPVAEQKLLKSYLRRWKLYQRSLPSPALRSNVAA